MKIQYNEPKDSRVTAERSFVKEFLLCFATTLICCVVTTLLFIYFESIQANPWTMVVFISLSVVLMGIIESIVIRTIATTSFYQPLGEIGRAARKVAEGDYTVRVRSQRSDDKKDEIEVLIDDFNTMVEEISTVETLKGDFIANVSHELKTPLSIIQNYVSALRDDQLPKEKRDEYIDTISASVKKQSNLITNILRLNKLDSQEIYEVSSFSLDEQLRCGILALDEKWGEKELDLDIDLDEVIISCDENLLEIVWNNLITNAIKFTEHGGKISIYLKTEENRAVITIKDTGCGMGQETSKRIFDRFYQGDTSHSKEGNGLGLSMVMRVIVLIEGMIEVESKEGIGTTFTVTLPLER